MDNHNFQKLLELLERESSARIASETARAAENKAFQQTIADLNTTIGQLNQTIGTLLQENRLLKGPKKNSGNSSVPPSKDENRPRRTNSLRTSRSYIRWFITGKYTFWTYRSHYFPKKNYEVQKLFVNILISSGCSSRK